MSDRIDLATEALDLPADPPPPEPEPAHRLVNGVKVLLSDAEIAERAAEEAAAAARPRPDRLIAKTIIYRRATDGELAALEEFLQTAATLRQRMMWQDAESGLVYVSEVLPLATALFGEARAAALLALA